MNRRSFLKTLGVMVGAAVVAPDLIFQESIPAFDPTEAYGDYLVVTDIMDEDIRTVALGILEEHMSDFIPEAYHKQVEYFIRPGEPASGDPLHQRTTIGWKYIPKGIADEPV